METRELVAGSFLEGCPVVRVSARTGEGLDALREAALASPAARPPRAVGRTPPPSRRPVVLLQGLRHGRHRDARGGERRGGRRGRGCCPPGRRARVRGLQVHGATVDRVGAGDRAAVNLAGVDASDVARGDVLAHARDA